MANVNPAEIKSFALCKGFTADELATFAEKLSIVYLSKGEVLFEEGSIGDSMYFIIAGKVEVLKHYIEDKILLMEMNEGDFFGEMSLVDEFPRSATIKAEEDCKLFILYRDDFMQFLKEYPQAGIKYLLAMTKELSRRIRRANQSLEDYHFMIQGLVENEKFRELYKSTAT